MIIDNFNKGEKVKYVGSNDYQKGVHTILKISNNSLFLNSFYTNAKYFIIDKHNLNSIVKIEGEVNEG